MAQADEKTILVVEDEPDVQMVLATALEDAGFNVLTADNGHEAYNQIKRQPPDLITLDLVMPRQSGALLYKKLRTKEKYAGVRVLIVSAHVRDDLGQADFEELMRGKDLPPPDGFLEKPVDVAHLLGKVGELLGVDVSAYVDEVTDPSRREVIEKLKTIDQDTLKKIQDMLKK